MHAHRHNTGAQPATGEDSDKIMCIYQGAGTCTYFPADGSISSGSSQFPAGIAQDPRSPRAPTVKDSLRQRRKTHRTRRRTHINPLRLQHVVAHELQAFIPSVKVFGLSDIIPFDLQVSGPLSSLRELVLPISPTSPGSDRGPVHSCSSCVETCDWDGEVKCDASVTVGGFQAAELTVKTFVTYGSSRNTGPGRTSLVTGGIFHDPEIYDDPENFIPDRYLLTENGTKPGVDGSDLRPNFILESAGACPGIHLAQNSININTMNLVWAFKFETETDSDGNPVKLNTFDYQKVWSSVGDFP
ncbi:hypothetical protein C8J57DRAFT_1247531 [Mycena rebaudengoi]|nr:hypothetical protein C8J57DRAFT_1247531 [Mycena rebaudengoi]